MLRTPFFSLKFLYKKRSYVRCTYSYKRFKCYNTLYVRARQTFFWPTGSNFNVAVWYIINVLNKFGLIGLTIAIEFVQRWLFSKTHCGSFVLGICMPYRVYCSWTLYLIIFFLTFRFVYLIFFFFYLSNIWFTYQECDTRISPIYLYTNRHTSLIFCRCFDGRSFAHRTTYADITILAGFLDRKRRK